MNAEDGDDDDGDDQTSFVCCAAGLAVSSGVRELVGRNPSIDVRSGVCSGIESSYVKVLKELPSITSAGLLS